MSQPTFAPLLRPAPLGSLVPQALNPKRRQWCVNAASWAARGALGVCVTACAGAPPDDVMTPKAAAPRPRNVPAFAAGPDSLVMSPAWQPHVMRRDLPTTDYDVVRRDQRSVLHAVAHSATSGLRWDWRVDAFATGATVADDARDDCPARVIVAFDGDMSQLSLRELMFHEQVELFTGHTLPFALLMYVWDGEAAEGSVFRYARSGRIRYLVVNSGPRDTGRWVAHRRNVIDDYRQVFGGEPGRIVGVGVLTDSDDLKVRSEAWFGDLRFS